MRPASCFISLFFFVITSHYLSACFHYFARSSASRCHFVFSRYYFYMPPMMLMAPCHCHADFPNEILASQVWRPPPLPPPPFAVMPGFLPAPPRCLLPPPPRTPPRCADGASDIAATLRATMPP